MTILAGSVVRVWGALEATLSRNEHSLSKSDRTMRALHVSFPDGSNLIGEVTMLQLLLVLSELQEWTQASFQHTWSAHTLALPCLMGCHMGGCRHQVSSTAVAGGCRHLERCPVIAGRQGSG